MHSSLFLTVLTDSGSILLLLTHLLLTFRLHFPQRFVLRGIRDTCLAPGGFSVLAVQLAAALGVGNIFGMAIAILSGGPGAVFWCWLSGFLGIATAYAEVLNALKHRRPDRPVGTWNSMKPILGRIYALLLACAGLFIGAVIPADALAAAFPVSRLWTALPLTLLTAFSVLGGHTRIRRICEGLVPFTALLYTVACFAVLYTCRKALPAAFAAIFREAFAFRGILSGLFGGAVSGGIGIRALREGVSKGLFSNEAGLGTAAIAADTFSTGDVRRQAMICATGVFWDTCIFCAITGLAFSGAYIHFGKPTLNAVGFCQAVFDLLPGGRGILLICTAALGCACIFGWYSIGSRAAVAGLGRRLAPVYAVLWIFSVFCGAFFSHAGIWQVSDCLNFAAFIPNIYILWKSYVFNQHE